jgi:hypothetical protein
MTLEILTPKNLRWKNFIVLLDRALTEGLPEGKWRCGNDGSGGSKHRYAEAVMAEFGEIDIDGTLEFFRQHGGYCDCEVLFNVDPDLDDPHGDAGATPGAA